MDSPLETLRWALLADDLSGACDSAVAFAKAGFRTRFELGHSNWGRDVDLVALSTETRESDPVLAAEAVVRACRSIRAAGLRLLFKKIDSVLRGPVRAEIEATLTATGLRAAVVCPAFPSQGRQVRDGRLLVHGEDRGPLPTGEGLELRDAETDEDLDRLAAELRSRKDALPTGSGGLAAAYARVLGQTYGRARDEPRPPRSKQPAAFWIGSEHAAALEQMERLEGSGLPHRLVRVDMWRDETDVAPLADAIEQGTVGALVLSGGATARRILEGLEARAIDVRGEAIPGAPWGTIVAGVADGLTVVTKSGGFGGPSAFADIAQTLSS